MVIIRRDSVKPQGKDKKDDKKTDKYEDKKEEDNEKKEEIEVDPNKRYVERSFSSVGNLQLYSVDISPYFQKSAFKAAATKEAQKKEKKE